MALDAKKRQKKLAKKASKRKATHSTKKLLHKAGSLMSAARQMTVAARSPLHECFVPDGLFETGIGSVIVSRKMPADNIGFSVFLLDVFCLGIKNAYFAVLPQIEYDDRIAKIRKHESLTNIHQTCARKLIEGAEAYAKDLGFSPHPDSHIAKEILGDIDPTVCPMAFEFGKDGKPFFMSGPSDTPAKCKKIVDTLEKRCGPDGFHYLIGLEGE